MDKGMLAQVYWRAVKVRAQSWPATFQVSAVKLSLVSGQRSLASSAQWVLRSGSGTPRMWDNWPKSNHAAVERTSMFSPGGGAVLAEAMRVPRAQTLPARHSTSTGGGFGTMVMMQRLTLPAKAAFLRISGGTDQVRKMLRPDVVLRR